MLTRSIPGKNTKICSNMGFEHSYSARRSCSCFFLPHFGGVSTIFGVKVVKKCQISTLVFDKGKCSPTLAPPPKFFFCPTPEKILCTSLNQLNSKRNLHRFPTLLGKFYSMVWWKHGVKRQTLKALNFWYNALRQKRKKQIRISREIWHQHAKFRWKIRKSG